MNYWHETKKNLFVQQIFIVCCVLGIGLASEKQQATKGGKLWSLLLEGQKQEKTPNIQKIPR
jgi:hypothetical protein